jgi:transcriptional regulator with XRE-family HTH domain
VFEKMVSDTPRRTKFPANLVGPQIRRLRRARGWSQAKLTERLQLNGLDISREVVGQIECRVHCLRDKEIIFIARTLGVEVSRLFFNVEQKPLTSFQS